MLTALSKGVIEELTVIAFARGYARAVREGDEAKVELLLGCLREAAMELEGPKPLADEEVR